MHAAAVRQPRIPTVAYESIRVTQEVLLNTALTLLILHPIPQ